MRKFVTLNQNGKISYNGRPVTSTATNFGELVNVSYENNTRSIASTQTAKAIFTPKDPTNYEFLDGVDYLEADIVINKIKITGITFSGATYV